MQIPAEKLHREVGLEILRPDLKWGRCTTKEQLRSAVIVARTFDRAGHSIRLFYQWDTDYAVYGNSDWPIETQQIVDAVPGLESAR